MILNRLLPAALLAALLCMTSPGPLGAGAPDSYIKVEIRGTLKTGIVAIGGETTGMLIDTKDGSLELDVKDRKMKETAEKLDGKTAVVAGQLVFRKGVERRLRMIVDVTSIKAAK